MIIDQITTPDGTVTLDVNEVKNIDSLFTENSIGQSGYQKLPSGLIIQWGYVPDPGASATTVTFPIAFPNNIFTFVGTRKYPADQNVTANPLLVNSYSLTSANVDSSWGTSTKADVLWIAIGN